MENINYGKALTEVNVVIQNSENDIQKLIPENFKKFVIDNMDKEYIPTINFDDEKWEDSVMEETQAILALLFRDYIVSKEERKKIIDEEIKEEARIEQEKRERYNIDKIFEKKNTNIRATENNVSMVEYKENVFIKIKKWIKNFFIK